MFGELVFDIKMGDFFRWGGGWVLFRGVFVSVGKRVERVISRDILGVEGVEVGLAW